MDHRKYIAFFILFSFSVFLGHNMVPHHHHVEPVQRAMHQPCSTDQHNSHEEDNHSSHCHAFNGLDFVKFSDLEVIQPAAQSLYLSSISEEILMELRDGLDVRKYAISHTKWRSSDISGGINLRAPPGNV